MLRNIGTKQENAFSGKVQPTLACLWIDQDYEFIKRN